MPVRRTGKEHRKQCFLAFFLILLCLPVLKAEESGSAVLNYPVIVRMDSRDTGFRQFISDVESNRRRLVSIRARPGEAADNLTIFQYTTRQGDDLFSIAARSSIPYSAIASLNRLSNPQVLEAGRVLMLPSCPGIFVPADIESDIEKLIGAARLPTQEYVELRITVAGISERFHFFPGADFTPTERGFFLNGGFRFPLRNYRLTSVYGIRQNPITGNIVLHQGIDLAAPAGSEVYAVAEGIVTEIGENPILGIYIIITHPNGWTSVYGHLQRVETVLRSNVRSGTLIGRVGSTGQSTGPHLHFELRQNGRAVDPSGRLRN